MFRRKLAVTVALAAITVPLFGAAPDDLPQGGVDGSCREHEPAVLDPETGEELKGAVEVCTIETFLQCEGATGGKAFVQIPGLANGGPLMRPIQIEPVPPPGSVTDGAGCGMYEEPFFVGTGPASSFDMSFRGIVTGNLDTLAFTTYFIPVGLERVEPSTSFAVDVRMTVNDESLFGTETLTSIDGTPTESPRPITVAAQAEPTETGLAYKLDWSVTGLDTVLGTADDAGTGADTSREVIVTLSSPTDPNLLRLPNGIDTWVWGTSEVPYGITYNPETLPFPRLFATT